jgi:hypothetical protein
MKRYLFLIVLATLSIDCTTKSEKIDSSKKGETAESSSSKAKSIKELVHQLDGTWLSDSYLAAIEKRKTVYGNPAYTTSVFGFSILKDSLIDGSDYLYGFSTHDAGYTWPISYNESNKRVEYDATTGDEIKPPSAFYINPLTSTTLELIFAKPAKKELYRKAALEQELNRILFEGTYTDQATNKTVTFTRDGKITGLNGRVLYLVQYDTEGEYATPFDAIFLFTKQDDEAGTPFHFKISGDTITLYTVNEEEVEKYVEYNYSIGAKAYTLIKNKSTK